MFVYTNVCWFFKRRSEIIRNKVYIKIDVLYYIPLCSSWVNCVFFSKPFFIKIAEL